VAGDMQRMPTTACTAGSLTGRKTMSGLETIMGSKDVAITQSYAGAMTFSGTGTYSGYQIFSPSGANTPFNGTDKVDSDCTFTADGYWGTITSDGGGWYISQGVGLFDFGQLTS